MKNKTQRILAALAASLIFVMQSGFSPATPPVPTPVPSDLLTHVTQVDTSRFPKVTVYISITDENGEPAPVSPSQIVIKENGKEMKPEQIGGSEDVGPLTTLLVMDISGSMNHGDKLKSAMNAARAYVDQARPSDQIGLVTFNTEIKYPQPLTTDRRKMIAAINAIRAQDDTAMYDAVAKSIDLLEAVQGRKAVIVMTDGLDNRSKMSPQQVLQLIGPSGLSISVIGLGDPSQSTGAITSLDEPALKAFAEQAGGTYGYANDADSLRVLYEKYGRALQSEYVITYTSPSKLRDGINRALSVGVEGRGGAMGLTGPATSYNPGGLVPEVAQPASWLVFFALLAGLVLLFFLPFLFARFAPMLNRKGEKKRTEKQGNIKVHSQSQGTGSHKIKLKG